MTAPTPPAGPDVSGPAPGVLRAAVGLTAVTGAAVTAYGAFLTAGWFAEPPDQVLGAALLVLLSLAWGAGLVVCARGLARRHRWAVAPVVTSALILGAVGWLLAGGTGAEVAAGWVVLALGAGCLVTVVLAGRHLG